VGTGNAPTAAPVISPAGNAGSGLTPGAAYKYAVSYVTAIGETLPGPVSPAFVPSGTQGHQTAVRPLRSRGSVQLGAMTVGAVYSWKIQVIYEGGVPAPVSPQCGPYVVDKWDWECNIGTAGIHPVTKYRYYPLLEADPPAPMLRVDIFRTTANGATYYHTTGDGISGSPGWAANCGTEFDSSLVNQYQPPAAGSLNAALVTVPTNANATITKRRIYRTAANGTQLKFLADLTNPSGPTTYTDILADAALGANAPTVDTSGIKEEGQVAAGASEMLVATTAPFEADGGASGGWVKVGNLVVRYTGIASLKLTGIPPTGVGSITAPLRFGAQVLVQPRLVGVPASGTGSIGTPIKKGTTITLRFEVQDDAAIAVMADRLKPPGQAAVTADGVIEDFVSDSRFGVAELAAQCQAKLLERKDPSLTVTFQSRDDTIQVGRMIGITIAQPPIAGTFRIHRIAFSEIAISGGLGRVRPLRTVTASNKLFSFANLLRQLRGREGGVP
jgi:hypothetical protein